MRVARGLPHLGSEVILFEVHVALGHDARLYVGSNLGTDGRPP